MCEAVLVAVTWQQQCAQVMMTRLFAGLSMAVGIALIACEGGQTGDSGDAGEVCENTPHEVELEETTPLGYSAAEVLALAKGRHTSPSYAVANAGTTDAGVVDEPNDVTVEVTYDGGARYYTHGDLVGGCDAEHLGVELDVTVHVVIPSRALDQTYSAWLRGSRYFAQIDGRRASAQPDPYAAFAFSEAGMAGVVYFESDTVLWPLGDPSCALRWPMGPDDGMPSAKDLLAAMRERRDTLDLPPGAASHWPTDTDVTGSVEFSGTPNNVCGSPRLDGNITVVFDATLTLTSTTDGTSETVPVRATGAGQDGGWYADAEYRCSSIGADSLPQCEPLGLDVGPFDELRETIVVGLGDYNGTVSVTQGERTIEGVTSDCSLWPDVDPPCPEEKPFRVRLESKGFLSPGCCL